MEFKEKLSKVLEETKKEKTKEVAVRTQEDWRHITNYLMDLILSRASNKDAVTSVRYGLIKRKGVIIYLGHDEYLSINHYDVEKFCKEQGLRLYYMLEDPKGKKISKKYVEDKVVFYLISL